MGVFEAVFLEVKGLDERELEFRPLSSGLLADASTEPMNMSAPKGANMIKILAEGHLVHKIGIAL